MIHGQIKQFIDGFIIYIILIARNKKGHPEMAL